MKTTVAKTFKTIFIVAAVLVLIAAAVLYFVDAPVVEEGETPTVAQKVILLGKQYLTELLAAAGVSVVGVIGVLAKLIYNAVRQTVEKSTLTSAEVAEIKNENAELKLQIADAIAALAALAKKQDVANNAILTTFALSELPASVRLKIDEAKAAYDAVGTTAENPETAPAPAPVAADDTTTEAEPATTAEPAEAAATPVVYL